MNNKIEFVLSLPIDQLVDAIAKKIAEISIDVDSQVLDDKDYLTRQEVAKKLNITLPTLHRYTKLGYLKSYRIGARILYKKCEIEASVIQNIFRQL